jgi:release factor glutamine methyltransferase
MTAQSTIGAARRSGRERLAQVSLSPGLDADVLLADVIGKDRAYLLAFGEQPLTDAQAAQYEALVARAEAGEPIPYVRGWRAFYDMELNITPNVLIPRPETELLLEQAIEFARARASASDRLVAFDIGTGSGALAVGLARHIPSALVYAVDINPAALEVARGNAVKYGVEARITFLQGDLIVPILERGIRADLVMANLPYIPSGELPTLSVSRYEPLLALDGGADGLDLIRRMLADLPNAVQPNALILFEIAAYQGGAALALAQTLLSPQKASIITDYAGLDRIIRAEL